jgi:hypothetical protein
MYLNFCSYSASADKNCKRGVPMETIDFFMPIVHSDKVKGAGCLSMFLLVLTMMPQFGYAGDLFPAAVQGWILPTAIDTYTPETLYQYIDGASELYISYGFAKLISRKYEKPGQPEIVVDFFDMGNAANAFGIFAHSQEKPQMEIGQDSEYLDGLLRFWKGRFYVSLLCSPETPESRSAVMELGRRLAEGILAAGTRPVVLDLLPVSGLIASTIRSFHHPAWQNTYVFISSENILEIGPQSEAVLAKYEQGEERPVVLLVLYPDSKVAERAFANLSRTFHLPAKGGEAVKLADKKYFAACLEKRIVAAVWHGGGAAHALELLSAVRAKMAAFNK